MGEEHLSARLVSLYIETLDSGDWSRLDADSTAKIQAHLSSCASCRERVEIQRAVGPPMFEIEEAKLQDGTPYCPSEQALYNAVAGIAENGEAADLLDHAILCAQCAPKLRRIASELNSTIDPVEQAAIDALPSSLPLQQQRLAMRLRESSIPSLVRTLNAIELKRNWRWIAVAAVLLLSVSTSTVVFLNWRTSDLRVERLLSMAYAEDRTLELRFSGARYGPIRVQRGATEEVISRPASLLEAELVIRQRLERHADSPKWLQAKGRAELLDGNYPEAVRTLDTALRAAPKSSDLLIDLAVAKFENAEASGYEKDYGEAAELLSQALEIEPDNTTALFDRAVVLGRLRLFTQAAEDWRHYLRIEPSGPWADDARARLSEVDRVLKQHSDAVSKGFYDSRSIVHRSEAQADVLLRSEEYLKRSIEDSLPRALTHSGSGVAWVEADLAGLRAISTALEQNHNDKWLTDVIATNPTPAFVTGIGALSAAAIANDDGDYARAYREAWRAKQQFSSAQSEPGLLMAQFEVVYALHLSRDGYHCLGQVRDWDRVASERSYTWLEAQFETEYSICSALVSDLGTARKLAERSRSVSSLHRYGNLFLRSTGLNADLSFELGDPTSSWRLVSAGLDQFWAGRYAPMTGYNLYTEFDSIADLSKQPYLQVFIWQQAVSLIANDPDALLRAGAHRRLSEAEIAVGMQGPAEREATMASALIAAAPPTNAVKNDQIEDEIWLADLEMGRGELNAARKRLDSIQLEIDRLPNRYSQLLYRGARGKLELENANWPEARLDLRSAVAIAELTLRGLRSEEDRAAWRDHASGVYRDLVELEFRSGNIVGALELWEWYKAISQALPEHRAEWEKSNKWNSEAAYPHFVQDHLRNFSNSSVLAYASFDDGLATWIYDDRGIRGAWHPIGKSQLEREIRDFLQLCSEPASASTGLRASARELDEQLISPVAQHFEQGRNLVIEFDPELDEPPFGAFVEANGEYLLERGPIASSLGLYLSLSLNPDRGVTSESHVVAVAEGNGVGNAGVVLPDASREAGVIVQGFANGRILERENATAAAIDEAIRETEVFHFAGHFGNVRGRTGLLLAATPDGEPQLFSVQSLGSRRRARLQLVVLSACNSGLGPEGRTDEWGGLVRAFLRVGASHVVASRWQVDSTQTERFMELFYRELMKDGRSPAAFWRAQQELRSHDETRQPYYWAAFDVTGGQS